MNPRSWEILEAAVRDFINFGEPVSSQSLFERYDFGIRPAMIRAELSHLTEEGYLAQPYHSAGRVPSDKGYEFFAELVLEDKRPESLKQNLANSWRAGELHNFLTMLSRELGIAAAAIAEQEGVYKEGLDDLMENVDWGPRDEIVEIVRDFESLEDRFKDRERELFAEDFLNVFIGRKSPLTKSDSLAVMTGEFEKDGEKVFLIAMGPKRMDYEKAAAIFKALKNHGYRK